MKNARRMTRDSRKRASRKRLQQRRAAGEWLESRRVLAGNITGTVYEDLDSDNVLDNGEGLSGWTVYADTNNNGTRESTEPQTTSSASGSYYLGGLTAG